MLRLTPDRHPRNTSTWTPERERKQGRPKEIWRRTTERGEEQNFRSGNKAARRAKDRLERPDSPVRDN
jgi:hypothetical protein